MTINGIKVKLIMSYNLGALQHNIDPDKYVGNLDGGDFNNPIYINLIRFDCLSLCCMNVWWDP